MVKPNFDAVISIVQLFWVGSVPSASLHKIFLLAEKHTMRGENKIEHMVDIAPPQK